MDLSSQIGFDRALQSPAEVETAAFVEVFEKHRFSYRAWQSFVAYPVHSWANPSLDPAQYHVLFESLKIGYAEDGYEERLISVATSTTNIALELKMQFRVAKPRDILDFVSNNLPFGTKLQ
jgi:hypothetical protein